MPMLRKLQACESEMLMNCSFDLSDCQHVVVYHYILVPILYQDIAISWPKCVIVDEVILRSRCDAGFRSSSKKRREFQILLTWTSLVVIFRLLVEELENLASLARLSLSRMFKWQDRDQEFDENLNFFPKLIWGESIILLTTTRRESSKQKSWNDFWFAKAHYIFLVDWLLKSLFYSSSLFFIFTRHPRTSNFREHE